MQMLIDEAVRSGTVAGEQDVEAHGRMGKPLAPEEDMRGPDH